MTALCGGGTSGPKLGTAAIIDVGAGYVALMMEKSGIPWLEFAAPLAVIPPLVLNTFCASDPPAMVALTQAESDALLNLTLGTDFTNGLGKLPAIIENLYWNEFCQCNSGTYTPASYPAQPSGSTTFVPQPTTGTQTLCLVDHSHADNTTIAGGTNNMGGFNTLSPVQPNLIRVHYSRTLGPMWPDRSPQFQQETKFGTNFTIVNLPSPTPDSVLRTLDLPVPFGCTEMDILVNYPGSPSHDDTWVLWFEQFCGAGLAGPGCCPPDVVTSRTLQSILNIVQSMQRNYAPFAYTKGAPHSGLTGSGSIAVSRAIGVQVAITAYPTTLQQLAGNPAYVKDMGWISVSEADGMIQERRVSQLAFTWFPQLAPLATQINYDFFTGVTATITPLLAED